MRSEWEIGTDHQGLEHQPEAQSRSVGHRGQRKDFMLKQSNPAATCRLNGKEKRLKRGSPKPQSLGAKAAGSALVNPKDITKPWLG